jgi:DNA-binding transcriptional LysR family regulator
MFVCINELGFSMEKLDLNLLVALDILLTEGSVVRAAERLQLSASAMSRTLSRLRAATGDPLLVRAGRGLVPTPRAIELRERVGQVVQQAQEVLRPLDELDLRSLEASFTLRTSDGFVENFGPALLARIEREAPGVRLRFVPKLDAKGTGLRDGSVDLETGVVHSVMRPEVRAQALFRDQFIGVVRQGHALTRGNITAVRYAAEKHVTGLRGVTDRVPIDVALAELGLERQCVAIVTGFGGALALVRGSDLVAAVPERHTASMRGGLFSFMLPFSTPEVTVSLLWHPRLDADPAHRWLRTCVHDACSDETSRDP